MQFIMNDSECEGDVEREELAGETIDGVELSLPPLSLLHPTAT